MRRILTFFLASCLFAAAALAAGEEGPKRKPPPSPNEVPMPFLLAPVSKDDTLIGYQYIVAKLIAASPAAADAVKLKLAFIQDALVRDVYRTPVGTAADPAQVDRQVLSARLGAIAGRIAGAKNVAQYLILDVKFAPLHPQANGATFAPGGSAAGPPAAGPEKGGNQGANGGGSAANEAATSKQQKDGKP